MSASDFNFFVTDEYEVVGVLGPGAVTASGNSVGIDLGDTGPAVTLLLNVGAITGTTPTMDLKLQSSKNDNVASPEAADAYADIPNASFAQLTSADTGVGVVSYAIVNRPERFVRLSYTVAGTTPSFTISGLILARKTRY